MEQQADEVSFRQQSVSLRRDQIDAIRRIAREDRHKNVSRVIQEAIDEFVRRREQEREERAA